LTTVVIKKAIALTWPKATGLSISPLVGLSASPSMAGGRQRGALPNPDSTRWVQSKFGPDFATTVLWCSAPVVL